MTGLRLRQLVIAARDAGTIDLLREQLGLGEPFIDPGVAEFGLTNAVFAIGDQFLEVVVPVSTAAPATRFIDRYGEGGYMAIFQAPDVAAARERADSLGIRRVWNIDLEDISASHMHPADIGGAIVSIDTPTPPEAWRWGGPDWVDRGVSGGIVGATLQSADPGGLTAKWAALLGTEVGPDGDTIVTNDSNIRFEAAERDALTAFHLNLPMATQHPGGSCLKIGYLDILW
ncbi:MAG: VOC family protein [Pseudomonadota bacterium]